MIFGQPSLCVVGKRVVWRSGQNAGELSPEPSGVLHSRPSLRWCTPCSNRRQTHRGHRRSHTGPGTSHSCTRRRCAQECRASHKSRRQRTFHHLRGQGEEVQGQRRWKGAQRAQSALLAPAQTFFAEPPDGNTGLLSAHDEVGVVLGHCNIPCLLVGELGSNIGRFQSRCCARRPKTELR